ncbi:MAG: hypothetical protein ACOCYB_07520 [Alkalispirochaeta sp.]
MDLIDRLNGPTQPDSVFARAFALRDARKPEDAESGFDDEGIVLTSGGSAVDAGAAVRALLRELQVQRVYGITTPSHLFSLLHRHLAVERGALLVPAQEGEHLPLATAGLDRTSTLRLRATEEELRGLLSNQGVRILGGQQRELFSHRLSRSDYRKSPRLALFPFFHHQRLLATLIVFESPILDLEPAVLDVILGALSDSAGQFLFNGRHRPMENRIRSVVLQRHQVRETLNRLEGDRGQRELQIVETDLDPMAETILEIHPHLDRERLLEDMVDTVALMVSATHDVAQFGQGRVMLLGLFHSPLDAELLVHLVGTTLSHLFGIGHHGALSVRVRTVDELSRET